MKPCGHIHDDPRCKICYWARSPSWIGRQYRALWVALAQGLPSPRLERLESKCRHLGDVLDRRNCNCPAKAIHECTLHGRTTLNDPSLVGDGVRTCRDCSDWEAEAPWVSSQITRHLLYYIYPRAGNGVWQRCVARLLRGIRQFDGRRYVGIAIDGSTSPLEEVQAAFGAARIDGWVVRPNDPNLREVQAFLPLLEKVSDAVGAGDITLYAHAKGVTRLVNDGETAHRWHDLLADVCLDYPALVERDLASRSITGALKKVGRGFGGDATGVGMFHYSGSWYWFRNRDLFSRDWRGIDRQWWGVEAAPGRWFHPDEAGCLFWPGTVPELDLYEMSYLMKVLAAFTDFKAVNAAHRRSDDTI